VNRVLVAVCGYHDVRFGFIEQIAHLFRRGPLPLVTAEGLYIQISRNMAVRKALESPDWDYLLSLDTDMIFPDSLLDRVEQYTDPIVGGFYTRKQYPDYGPISGNMDQVEVPQFTRLSESELVPMLDNPDLYPVDVLGTGCLAIRRDVLENWPDDMRPWFATMTTTDGCDIVTEDVYFCWRAKQQGIQPILDTQVRCGHVGPMVFGAKTYRQAVAV
jgi:hypothetical protein